MTVPESQPSLEEAQAVAGIEQTPFLYEGAAKLKLVTREIEVARNSDGIPVAVIDELERRRNRLWRALEQAARDSPVDERRQREQWWQMERERERQFQRMVL
ncbi:hypothetical protein C483_00205 [Natrialba hulunbeirensis JCM 10989]|uniref:Uncharacterized protein n=1 Tax=Natrialba hulunbeirensis JCM 10989 TaxID=1227493 RepID=M0ACS9_9EURY|nr:hypothetical protein C483_00205 [Natrialba hulunbeirensis JCM 10989]